MTLAKSIQLVSFVAIGILSIAAGNVVSAQENDTEAEVRAAFEKQMKSQEARIEKAEADLKRIRIQFEKRLENAEQIIAQHTKILARQNSTTTEVDSDVSAAVLASEGWQAWQKQDWRTALAKFESAIQKDPKAANTINGLGWTYLHLGEYEKAIEAFENALRLDATHSGALNGIGQCLIAMGRNDEAVEKLTSATEATIDRMGESTAIKNQVTASWFGLVRALTKKGDNEAAIKWADRYLAHSPDDANMKSLLEEAKSQKSKAAP